MSTNYCLIFYFNSFATNFNIFLSHLEISSSLAIASFSTVSKAFLPLSARNK